LASICSRVSGGRVLLRPEGSPIIEVKSPMRNITVCPRSCSWRILFSTTVWPMWMSGAVGSRPSFTRSGLPVAAERASFFNQSACGSSSSQPRSDSAMASRTASVSGKDGVVPVAVGSDIGCYRQVQSWPVR
jgi:hypothetical protein